MLLYPTHPYILYMVFGSVDPHSQKHTETYPHTYTETNMKQKTNKHHNLIINSEYSDSESKFEDALHSE